MATQVPPKKNTAYTFEVSLVSQADSNIFQTSVTLAEGDVTVSLDGGSFTNIDSLPTEIGTSGVLTVTLATPEMDADRVAVLFHDAADDEWQDALVTIHTAANQVNDLATATALATVDSNVDAILLDTGTDGVVLADEAITAAKIASDAIAAAKIADGAITAAKIADAAIDNATFASDVGSTAYSSNLIALAVRKALDAIDLDHLIEVTAGSEEPTDGSYLDQIMHKDSDQTFSSGTDSLEAIRDTLSSTTITVVSATSGSAITVVPYTTWEFTEEGLADLSDAAASGIFFTVKENYTDADSEAILQVQEGAGLLYLNKTAASDATKATLTVGDNEDAITVHVNASVTGLVEKRSLVWDIKKVITVTEDADQVATGAFHIGDPAVTRRNTTS